jgi:hypothetical protein
MMLPLRWAGAQHSQSPVGADMKDGDEGSMLFRSLDSVVIIAHVPKECLASSWAEPQEIVSQPSL